MDEKHSSMTDIEGLLSQVTPWPWRLGSWGDWVFGTGPNGEWLNICRVKRDDLPVDESKDHIDARLIAMAPALAREVLELRRENERLLGEIAKLSEAGEPPA